MVGQKDKSFAGFRINKTDPAQMLRILLPCVEAVKRDIRDANLEDAAALAGKGFSVHCGQCNGG